MHLIRPSDFPRAIEYKIWGQGDDARLLAKLLSFAVPASVFRGFCDGIDDDPKTCTVLFQPEQLSAWETAASNGATNVIMIALPVGNPWGYWELFKSIHPFVHYSRAELRPVMDRAEFLASLPLIRKGYWALEANGVSRLKKLYLCDFKGFFEEKSAVIDYVAKQLSDRESENIFRAVIEDTPLTAIPRFFGRFLSDIQYFDYVSVGPGDVIINGGVFEGSEIPLLAVALQGAGQVYGLDPLGDASLTDYVRGFSDHYKEVFSYHRLALTGHDGVADMATGESGQVVVGLGRTEGRAVFWPCCSIDGFVRSQKLEKLSLIKLDVEGSEVEVIDGMDETIARFRPQLAISIYHNHSQYIYIPYVLMSKLKNYNFYLKHYSFERWEVILYCIPRETDRNAGCGFAVV
ncbi:MAG: FkbM family methyltransferase [Verrucomicrobiota bacterium]